MEYGPYHALDISPDMLRTGEDPKDQELLRSDCLLAADDWIRPSIVAHDVLLRYEALERAQFATLLE